ncbi:MAG: acetolactate synthase small subunit [Candidatus Goldiibacteriota bacterium]
MENKKTISVLVENQPGVLARIAGLFSGRDFNIESLAVGETEEPSISRMTIVARGDEIVLGQIVKQLNKLIDVIKVLDMSGENYVERELALVRVNVEGKNRGGLMDIVEIFRGKVLDVFSDAYMVEITGTDDKIEAFIDAVRPYGVKEMIRTGTVALLRGKRK